MHGVEPKGVDCPAIDGIIEEAEEIAGEVADKEVLDAGLMAAAQAVEHYEITRYGTLVAWAKQLGRDDCATRAAAEPRRGKGDRQEADRARRSAAQPESGQLILAVSDPGRSRGGGRAAPALSRSLRSRGGGHAACDIWAAPSARPIVSLPLH